MKITKKRFQGRKIKNEKDKIEKSKRGKKD